MDKPEFVVDAVNVQIVVARMEGGHKVGEMTFQPVRLLYPFDLDSLCEQAVAKMGESQEDGGGA